MPYKINEKNELEMDFVKLPLYEESFRDEVSRGNAEALWKLWDRLLAEIEASSECVEQQECLVYELQMDEYREGRDYGKILREGYVDMIPRNCFVKGKELLWFDQEWVLENIPSKFILYRGMVEMYKVIPEFEDVIPMMEFVKHYKMEECLEAFMALNELFLQMVANPYYVGVLLERVNKYIYRKNVLKLL